ncbi:SPFH domain-containing protein [Paenibacillus albidus]|uniref:SPFH domain-containing protein n=1 Tax=Paenibacillus albidus TaxID=2041023 RepID=UPI001BE7DAD4|nr:SPFH domain-containing protein [Paenibacillus albidus]MBT2290489.1 SPFH domain-containing protein [Paenibacillus albidus]
MAIIEVVKYDGPPGVFAWKYPNQELGTWTQLIVNEAQEAILFKGGRALDSFRAGRHTLSTANIPVLSNLVNLPFGGRSPFTAEVWYVNTMNSMNVKWGTSSPLQLQDPKYKIIVSVRSFGQFGIRIADPRKFLLKLVGTLPQFDQETMVSYFRGLLMTNINELISSYLVHKKISILEINAYIVEISKHIQGRLAGTFWENGIELNNFYIDSINIPADDPATVRLKEALAKKAEMDIIGFTYQQERSFDTLEEAAGNPGNMGAGMMNAGMGLGLGMGFVGPGINMVNQMTRGMGLDTGASGASKPCSKCSTLNTAEARFCSGCGHGLQSAPEAGTAGAASACHACGKALAPGAKFCPHCGQNLVIKCSGCGHELKPGQKFCAECGTKAN